MKSGNFARKAGIYLAHLFMLSVPVFLVELLAFLLLQPEGAYPLAFAAVWSLLFGALCLVLPRRGGRILFGVIFYVSLLWTLAQTGYYQVFGKLMWLSTVSYAGEGATFLGDVIAMFPWSWWVMGIALMGVGVLVICLYPKETGSRIPPAVTAVLMAAALFALPELVFLRDNSVWGTKSEFGQSSSYRSTYNTMYDAKNVYDVCGVFQLTFRDLWKHEIYPKLPAYRNEIREQEKQVQAYFEQRGEHQDNEMTGIFRGKNVILVLMESMDDWMFTQEDTPTLCRLRDEGIDLTEFYTPGYGGARTFNSEFCMNTGIYLPTTGAFVFDYVTNRYRESIAGQLNGLGYDSRVFHYNDPDFYSRGVFEKALGYEEYVYYGDYEEDEDRLFDDCLLFDNEGLNRQFFREGQTFNTIITRSAHLSYKYNEVLSYYALKKYPEYRGKYASEEEDCARVKARLVDDLFARLLKELEAQGQLENTVIVAMTDHYTYGYKNVEELMALSGVDTEMELEKTACFIWSPDCPDVDVTKTTCTADVLPTVLNLLGADSPYDYLGQDAFDPEYPGYAVFPDGSFVCDGVICQVDGNEWEILENPKKTVIDDDYREKMNEFTQSFIAVNNLLLTCDYYRK